MAQAKQRDDASATAAWFRKYRKNSPPPELPRTLNRGIGGHRFKKSPKTIRANLALQAKTAHGLARAGDWYLIQGGYDVNGQPLKGLQLRFRSVPIKRPRNADMSQHREARAYCKDKFGVNISADTARECCREFLAFERALTGKKREFSALPAPRKPGKTSGMGIRRPKTFGRKPVLHRSGAVDKVAQKLHADLRKKYLAAQWIADTYGRDRIDDD